MSKQQGPMDLRQLRGTVAVVTGAGNHGIGWGLCCHAAGALGMHVIVIDLHESSCVKPSRDYVSCTRKCCVMGWRVMLLSRSN